MMNTIYFDMDGTLAALFFIKGFSEALKAGDTTPYTIAKPLFDTDMMATVIAALKAKGYDIGIISYVDDKNLETGTKAKKDWLTHYFPYANPAKIHIVTKATPKSAYCTKGDVLVDDAKANRDDWENVGGITINAYFKAKVSMIEALKSL